MAGLTAAQDFVKAADKENLKREEEAVEIAQQWAQEKIDNFLLEVESSGENKKMLNINYIISRRSAVDVFSGHTTTIGKFVKELVNDLVDGKLKEAIGNLAGQVCDKLLGSSSGSAQTKKLYEITFDELGGLNRLDCFFFCYKFTSSGLAEFQKAVIGSCIIRSAALMLDDNAYRVALTSCATLPEIERGRIGEFMVQVAENQTTAFDQDGKVIKADPGLQKARAELRKAIGDGVAHSIEAEIRRATAEADRAKKLTSLKKPAKDADGAVTKAKAEIEAVVPKMIDEGPSAAEIAHSSTANKGDKKDENEDEDEDEDEDDNNEDNNNSAT